MRILLLLLLLSSCGALIDPPKHDRRFNPIMRQFQKEAAFFGVDVNPFDVAISFGDTKKGPELMGLIRLHPDNSKSSEEAYCSKLLTSKITPINALAKITWGKKLHGKKYIIISNELKGESLEYLESLVYHELGHCALDREHEEQNPVMSTHGIYEFGSSRYFILKSFFQRMPYSEPETIIVQSRDIQNEDDYELIYETEYEAFNQVISNRLYRNILTGEITEFKAEPNL